MMDDGDGSEEPPLAEVILRLRRAETRLAGLFFMFYAGSGYMTDNPSALFLTSLLGYESDTLLKANFDYAGIDLKKGRYGGLVGALSVFDITVVLEGDEGKNRETRRQIQYFKFGEEPPLYPTMQDQMEAGVTIAESDLFFIKHGHPPAVSLEPAVRLHRGQPTSVLIEIFDDKGKRICGELDPDRMFALSHLLSQCERLPAASGVDAISIPKQYLPGRRADQEWVRRVSSRGGCSASTKRRRSQRAEDHLFECNTTVEEAGETIARCFRRNRGLKEAVAMYAERAEPFTDAESKHILTIVKTQQMYRELASTLRLKFNARVLAPIDTIVEELAAQLSEVESGIATVTVQVAEVVVGESGKQKKRKVLKQVTAPWWRVKSVAAELQLKLNALGQGFKALAIGGLRNTLWYLLGGDKGGKPVASFKFGAVFLNQKEALSSLNVSLLSQVMAKDCREILVETALTPAFCAQVDALKNTKVVRVVVASKNDEGPCNVEYSTDFVPERLAIIMQSENSDSPSYYDASDIGSAALHGSIFNGSDGPEEANVGGLLAVRDGVIIGVVAVEVVDIEAMLGVDIPPFKTRDSPATPDVLPSLQVDKNGKKIWRRIVAFYAFSEPLAPPVNRRGFVFVEILHIRLKLTADHEFFRIVFGHQGAAAKLPCWCCTATKEDFRVLLKDRSEAHLRTPKMYSDHAALFPRNISKSTTIYKSNMFCSVEHKPLLVLDASKETSCGPLHCMLGSTQNEYEVLKSCVLLLDGADSEVIEASKKCTALEARALKAAALAKEASDDHQQARKSLGPQETRLKKRKLHHDTAITKMRNAPQRSKERATNALAGAEALLEEAQRTTDLSKVEVARLQSAETEAKAEESRANTLLKVHLQQNRFKLGPLSTVLQQGVSKLGVQEQAFFQKLIGNHCEKLLKNYEGVFDALREKTATLDEATKSKFESFITKASARWENLATISLLSLKAEILSEEDIARFCKAADAYQDLIIDFDFFDEDEEEEEDDDDELASPFAADKAKPKTKKAPLKAHMYTHMKELARTLKTIGMFSESPFESIHALMNAIARAYLGMKDPVRQMLAVRKGLAARQDADGREAKAAVLAKRATTKRKTS